MTILSGDVKLLKSERLLDTPDGGGRMTGHVVVDGQSNNLFPDISELDRTYGRVSLRKAYVGVMTDNTDSYYGAHVIAADEPDDPNVAVTMFTTKSWTDRRADAKDRVERYLARSVKWPGQILERQLAGQRAIALLLKPADPLPHVGQALVLVQDEAKATEYEQYIRVTKVTTTIREFVTVDGRFTGVVVTCEISDPLRYDFEGPPPSPRDDVAAKAVCRDTIVANAAVYYGIMPTVVPAHIGDMRVQVTSLFGQLVPSAQSETPLVDLNAAGQSVPLIESGNGVLTYTTSAQVASGKNFFIGNGILPGSLTLTGGGYTFTDAAGELKSGATSIGTLDYARGTVTFGAGTPSFSGNIAVTFRPAGAPVRVADTAAIAIYPENRGYSYTITLSPMPKPGSLIVSYMSQGKWYDLRDNGSGALKGTDSSFGVGSLNYTTGSVILTTGALPDASSTILFSWGTAVSYFNRSAIPVPAPSIRCLVAHTGIVPGTLTISWTDGANTRTIADNSHGAFTGPGTGTVRYAAGEIFFRPTTLPAGGAVFTIHYEWGPPLETSFPHPLRNPDGTITVTLPQTDIRPNSVELEFNLLIDVYPPLSLIPMEMQLFPRRVDPLKIARDNGVGTFDSGVTGSINYTTGVITFTPDMTVNIPYPRYDCVKVGYEASFIYQLTLCKRSCLC
ncbi:hypothetical protein CCP4SC76_4190001 [Gammaproteobacteria bacterium]